MLSRILSSISSFALLLVFKGLPKQWLAKSEASSGMPPHVPDEDYTVQGL